MRKDELLESLNLMIQQTELAIKAQELQEDLFLPEYKKYLLRENRTVEDYKKAMNLYAYAIEPRHHIRRLKEELEVFNETLKYLCPEGR